MSNLFSRLFPSEYAHSIYEYDFNAALENGRRVILFDIDNTLVPHGAPADERSIELISGLKDKGFYFCAVSNNKEPRVKMFCDAVGVPYVYSAGKPDKGGYLKALKLISEGIEGAAHSDETLFFGDQIFTDIWGANNAGIHSVLVKPIDKRTDEIQIVLKRILEKPVVKAYFREKGIAIRDYFN